MRVSVPPPEVSVGHRPWTSSPGLRRRTAGIWGPLAFTLATAAAARKQSGFSHQSHHISGLAARGTPSAPWMIPGFVALGASSLMMPTPSPGLGRLTRIAGVTTIAAGIVQVSDPRCPQPGSDPAATPSDAGHAVASVATFLTWAAMPIFASRVEGVRWYRSACCILAVAAVGGLAWAGVTTRRTLPHRGVAQRVFLGVVFAWHIATALSLRPCDRCSAR